VIYYSAGPLFQMFANPNLVLTLLMITIKLALLTLIVTLAFGIADVQRSGPVLMLARLLFINGGSLVDVQDFSFRVFPSCCDSRSTTIAYWKSFCLRSKNTW